jgi:hypothetical protein
VLLVPLGREVGAACVEAHVLVLRDGGGATTLRLVLMPQYAAARQAAPAQGVGSSVRGRHGVTLTVRDIIRTRLGVRLNA